ncbi:MAG TPA: hypothetical protein VMA77_00485 [Solirubrobacteraceae bacterium]|nr:hypothetical protein [Solirubrobacteraceae bacterium]
MQPPTNFRFIMFILYSFGRWSGRLDRVPPTRFGVLIYLTSSGVELFHANSRSRVIAGALEEEA